MSSLNIAIVKEGEEPPEGDVVIVTRDAPEFFDVVVMGGRELKSLVAIGAVREGAVVGIGKYTKKPVAAVINGRIYIKALPLTLYLETGYLKKELSEVLNMRWTDVDIAVRKLKELIIAERRKYKRSPTLTAIYAYLNGERPDLPPHVADMLGTDREAVRKVLERLLEEVY